MTTPACVALLHQKIIDDFQIGLADRKQRPFELEIAHCTLNAAKWMK